MDTSPFKLRFGVIPGHHGLGPWEDGCLKKLEADGNATLVNIIVSHNRSENAFADLEALKNGHPSASVLQCATTADGNTCEYFAEEDVKKIAGTNLDFILALRNSIPQGEILSAARLGVWSFRHGHQAETNCFWEVYNDESVTPAILGRMRTLPEPPDVLWSGYFKTIRTSAIKNHEQVVRGSTDWPSKVCKKILLNGDSDLVCPISSPLRHKEIRAGNSRPSLLQSSLLRLKLAKRRVEASYRLAFRYTTWNVGIVESPIESFLEPDFKPKVRWFPQSRNGHIQADPFGHVKGNALTILYERLDYLHRKGNICAVTLENGHPIPDARVVMEMPVHMSYPYLFEYEGEICCVPETNQARQVCLYKAADFPSKWTRAAVLLSDIRAIDTTVFEYNGDWWMTFTDREKGGDTNLWLWNAPSPVGPWKSHPLNPVKTDVRSARPGGTPFIHRGDLYRPAQDCSRTGGGRVVLNRIEKLTRTDFREVEAGVVEPFKNSIYKAGMHTLSAAGSFTLVDGKRFRFIPTGLWSNVIRGLGRLKRL